MKAAVSAGMWTLAGHGSSQALRLLGNLLLTRLLAPDSFGVMALATVVYIGVAMFSDLGLQQVVVHSDRADEPEFVNTVWTLQILQGVAVAGIMLAIAGALAYARAAGHVPAGSTYASRELPLLIAGLAVTAVLAGVESTRLATAEKAMVLRHVVLLEVGSQAVALIVMCTAAAAHPSVFVLLLGAIVGGAVKAMASHRLPGGIPNRIHLSLPIARDVCRISSWIVVSSALTFLVASADKLFLGWLLDAHTMGQYAIAALLAGALTETVARVSSRVSFPAITRAWQRDGVALAHSYHRSRIPTDAFCLGLAAVLFWFGDGIVRLIYDQRYAQAGEFLRALGITLVGARYAVVPYMYLLLGRTRLMAAEQALRLGGLLLGISLGYALYGTTGAVWGVALGQLAGAVAALLMFHPRLGLLSARVELLALGMFAVVFGLLAVVSH